MMKYKLHAEKVREVSEERKINPVHAVHSLIHHKEKSLGKLYSEGFRTGFNRWERLTRKDFIRNRDFRSYLTGYLNGLRLNRVFK